MNKYPLIGVSTIAVVLLILGSLTNVVGYQSVQSSTVSGSPLFSMRTKRAINEESKDLLISKYLGKTNNINLLIPTQSNQMELFHIAINRIQTMDDSSFERFVRSAVAQLSKQEQLNDITPQQLITGLHQIRDNPQAFIDYTSSISGNKTWKSTPTLCWFPGCLIILGVIYIVLKIFVFLILGPYTSANWMSVCFCP